MKKYISNICLYTLIVIAFMACFNTANLATINSGGEPIMGISAIGFIQNNGHSSYPTYKPGSVSIVKIVKNIQEIDRYSFVGITSPEGHEVAKRVIGLPGEHIEVINDEVFINGEKIADPYKYLDYETDGGFPCNYYEVTLGEGEIFVLGDNRLFSKDSTELGPYKISDIDAIYY